MKVGQLSMLQTGSLVKLSSGLCWKTKNNCKGWDEVWDGIDERICVFIEICDNTVHKEDAFTLYHPNDCQMTKCKMLIDGVIVNVAISLSLLEEL
jgi:hypothetical protein